MTARPTLKVLDLNDWELSLYGEREPGGAWELAVQAPGFAMIDGKNIHFGEQAMQTHRRTPLGSYAAYWHRMDASPLRSRNREVRTGADLVFHQLRCLIAESEGSGSTGRGDVSASRTVITVPSHYSKDQLAVLLGIIEQTNIAPVAMVDSLIAAGATDPADFIIDLSLHQMTIVRSEVSPELVKRVTVESVPDGGLLPLLDAWLARIADEFVRETRFDPLRIADTEQQLWSHLYAWLSGEVSARDHGLHLEVSNSSGHWHVNFDTRELERMTAKLVQDAVALCAEVEDAALRVSARAARIPGLVKGIREAGIRNCATLAADAVVRGIAGNADVPGQDSQAGIRFMTALETVENDATAAGLNAGTHTDMGDMGAGTHDKSDGDTHRPGETRPSAPTHLVYAGAAYEVPDGAELTTLISAFPESDSYRLVKTADAIHFYRIGEDAEEPVQSLGCGEVFATDGGNLLAIRLA